MPGTIVAENNDRRQDVVQSNANAVQNEGPAEANVPAPSVPDNNAGENAVNHDDPAATDAQNRASVAGDANVQGGGADNDNNDNDNENPKRAIDIAKDYREKLRSVLSNRVKYYLAVQDEDSDVALRVKAPEEDGTAIVCRDGYALIDGDVCPQNADAETIIGKSGVLKKAKENYGKDKVDPQEDVDKPPKDRLAALANKISGSLQGNIQKEEGENNGVPYLRLTDPSDDTNAVRFFIEDGTIICGGSENMIVNDGDSVESIMTNCVDFRQFVDRFQMNQSACNGAANNSPANNMQQQGQQGGGNIMQQMMMQQQMMMYQQQMMQQQMMMQNPMMQMMMYRQQMMQQQAMMQQMMMPMFGLMGASRMASGSLGSEQAKSAPAEDTSAPAEQTADGDDDTTGEFDAQKADANAPAEESPAAAAPSSGKAKKPVSQETLDKLFGKPKAAPAAKASDAPAKEAAKPAAKTKAKAAKKASKANAAASGMSKAVSGKSAEKGGLSFGAKLIAGAKAFAGKVLSAMKSVGKAIKKGAMTVGAGIRSFFGKVFGKKKKTEETPAESKPEQTSGKAKKTPEQLRKEGWPPSVVKLIAANEKKSAKTSASKSSVRRKKTAAQLRKEGWPPSVVKKVAEKEKKSEKSAGAAPAQQADTQSKANGTETTVKAGKGGSDMGPTEAPVKGETAKLTKSAAKTGAWKDAAALDTIAEVAEEEEADNDTSNAPANVSGTQAEDPAPKAKAAKNTSTLETIPEASEEEESDEEPAKAPAKAEASASKAGAAKSASTLETIPEAVEEEESDEEPAKKKAKGKTLGKTVSPSGGPKKGGSASRSELLKRLLVDQYKADKGKEEKESKKEEKKKKSKLEKAASFGEKLSAAAGLYDNSKKPNENFEKIKKEVFEKKGNTEEEKPNDANAGGMLKKNGESKTQEEKKDEKEVKKDPDKAANDAAKEVAKESSTGLKPADNPAKKEEAKPEKKEEKKEEKKDEKKDENPLPIKEMATGVADAYNNTIGAISSLYASRKSNSRKAKMRGRFRGTRHILGAVSDLSGGASALLGSGKVGEGSGINIANGVLQSAGGGLNIASAALRFFGDRKERKMSGEIADKAAEFSKDTYKYRFKDAAEEVEKVRSLKDKAFADDPERYEEVLGIAKKRRSTEKANKLAMAIAEKFNRQKSQASTKGMGDLITGSAQVLDGVLTATGAAGKGFVKSIVSPLVKTVASEAKKYVDKRDAKKQDEEKKADTALRGDTVKEYLEGKRAKIKAQAKAVSTSSSLSDEEKNTLAPELTDAEADKIALARLGVSVPDLSGDKPASDTEMMTGFDKIIMRRANNILAAYNKDDMLDALMLSHDATVEEVAAALKGE